MINSNDERALHCMIPEFDGGAKVEEKKKLCCFIIAAHFLMFPEWGTSL